LKSANSNTALFSVKYIVSGVQKRGVGTSIKHFAANNNEDYRFFQNSEMDERTFYEIYAKVFQIALKSKPWTVMCSYNLFNGVFASENPALLNTALRGKLGYNGVIVSDWGACHNRARALKATLDLEMPDSKNAYATLEKAYNDGFITESEINASVKRLLELIDKVENGRKVRKITKNKEQRHKTAVEIAEECIVLLKNDNGILPLAKGKRVDVYNSKASLCYGGGGSAFVSTDYEIKGIDELLANDGFNIKSFVRYNYPTDADYCILCVGNDETTEAEGFDRKDLSLKPADEEMIIKCAERNSNTIVLIYSGSAIDVSRWIDKVSAVIYVGFCGEGANEALANILSGKISPSGKLAESFPVDLQNCPIDKSKEFGSSLFYKERFFFGYRYFDLHKESVRFPFGYGLSYAKFEYSAPWVKQLGESKFTIGFDITNVSDIAAKEVVQIYVGDVFCTSERPMKELKAFKKVLLAAGETKTIEIDLDKEAFSFYNPAIGDWYVENGTFDIFIASSSQDIKLKLSVGINLEEYSQFSQKNTVVI